MSYSIPSSTKTLTLTTGPFLFISVGALSVCEFAMVQECIFYCAPRKKRYTVLPEGTDIHIQQHNHRKGLNPFLSLYYYGKVIVELENNTNTKFNCVYCVCNLTKFLFVSDFS